MTHTFEIIQSISPEDLLAALSLFKFRKWQINKFLFSNKKSASVRQKLSKQFIGFKEILFINNTLDFGGRQYYCVIRLEPLAFIQGEHTVDVFNCTEENINRLKSKFHEVMSKLLEDKIPCLCSLENWNCRRIDYTKNLQFESQKQAAQFLRLTKKTSRYIRSEKQEMGKKFVNQSTAEGNKSLKVITYGKHKQILERYNDISKEEKNRLLHDAEGIARFEVQCKKPKVQVIGKVFGSKCILNYLDESIANTLIYKYYGNAIGYGDFYSFYHAKTIIEKSSLKPKRKEKLIHFLQLIAQARHLDIAEEQFIAGTKIKRTDIEVKGSSNTFRTYLKELESLNINPILIPKDWKVKSVQNPCKSQAV